MSNSPESKLLLAVLKQQNNPLLAGISWQKFIRLAKYHDLIPLAFYRLRSADIPQETLTALKSEYQYHIARNMRLWQEFLEIHTTFQRANIPMLPLKGMDTLIRFYPEINLRGMEDIDILVNEADLQNIEKIFLKLGFQKYLEDLKEEYWRSKQCHIAFWKSFILVEVHWQLDFKRGGRAGLSFLWQRTSEVSVENHNYSLLSPEDALFSLALHLRRFGPILALKQVRDAARIIATYSETLDWDYILKEGSAGKIAAPFYFLLMQVKLFTDTPVPAVVLDNLGISPFKKRLIKKFILKNTFSPSGLSNRNQTYLRAHFLLYDNFYEPLKYIINIPLEQFAKFYNLPPYNKKTQILYALRFFTIPFLQLLNRTKTKT